jgi:hypothetical protein
VPAREGDASDRKSAVPTCPLRGLLGKFCHYLTRPPLGNGALRQPLTLSRSNGRSEMADRELIAAILTAGMLPTLEVPQTRGRARNGPVTRAEAETIQSAVDHAFGLYRLVLAGLGVDPLESMAGRDAQPQAPAVAAPNGAPTWSARPEPAHHG